jgi:hypothetical protein
LAGVPQCTAAKAIDRVRDSGLVCEMYNAVQNWVQRKATVATVHAIRESGSNRAARSCFSMAE